MITTINYKKNYIWARNKKIIELCKDKNVLHIWPCDSPFAQEKYNWKLWPLLYRDVDLVCKNQLWIDIINEDIEFFNSKVDDFPRSKIIYFDMNNLENLDYKPDVIIFSEVIEHLMNIEIALSNLKKIMTSDTLLIIDTPNAFYIWNFIYALFSKEIMHNEHTVYFSYWFLQNILNYNRLSTTYEWFCYLDYHKSELSLFKRISRFIFEDIFYKFFPALAPNLFFVCKLNENIRD
jgi:SAM-dependent methyltransferase